jgi:hypothetical protein
MSEYLNSGMQKRTAFNTTIEYISTIGDNFWKVMIFCAVSEAASNFIASTPPVAGDVIELKASTYEQVVKGTLAKWCRSLFNNSANTVVYAVMYTDIVEAAWNATNLGVQYQTNKPLAYWKTALYATSNAATLALDALISAETVDKKLSKHIVGTADAECLDADSATGIVPLLLDLTIPSKAWVVYHYNADVNPVLEQLGRSFALINTTGTPVGNKLELLADDYIDTSKDGDTNFTPLEYAELEEQNIGYFTSLTESELDGVFLEFGTDKSAIDLQNNNVCAEWIVNYINYRAERLATLKLGMDNVFLNNKTYTEILTMLEGEIVPFTVTGRFSSYKITAPKFSSSIVSGKTIVIPTAWEAYYADDCGGFTVSGTLYINI